jgi:hypothetical protein
MFFEAKVCIKALTYYSRPGVTDFVYNNFTTVFFFGPANPVYLKTQKAPGTGSFCARSLFLGVAHLRFVSAIIQIYKLTQFSGDRKKDFVTGIDPIR